MPMGNDLIMGWEKRHVAYRFDLFGNERLIYITDEGYCSCWWMVNKRPTCLQEAYDNNCRVY